MYIQILLSLNSLGLTALVMYGGGIPRSANSFAVFMAIFTVFILSWLGKRLLLIHHRVAFGRSPPSKRDIVGAECNLSHDTALFVYQLSHNSAATLRRRKWAPQVLASQIYSLVFFGGEMPKQSSVEEKQLCDIHPVGVEAGRRCYWSDTMEVLEVGILSPMESLLARFPRHQLCRF